jgi:DNA invertase Pin-like site-specific DNA recombinase
MSEPDKSDLGYSYLRFSSTKQAAGDSERRQTDGRAEDFCQRHGLTLDTTLTMHDKGVPAFRGENKSDVYCLGKFLALARRGRIKPGSYLVIENLDRLSREEERPALRLWMDILDLGINIATLEPETIFRPDKSDMMDIMRALMELSRAHAESARKSSLLGKVWRAKKDAARQGLPQPDRHDSTVAGTKILTHRLPGWITEVAGKPVLIPERALVVRRIFQLARQGYGYLRIVARLTEEGVPPFGKVAWVRSTIANIVKGREALGEYQPRKRVGKSKRVPDGEPIREYYPAVVTRDEWDAAQTPGVETQHTKGKKKRSQPRGGRVGKHINLFSRGMIRNARDGGTYMATTRCDHGSRARVLVPTASLEGRGPMVSFPLPVFERAILSCLAELDAHAILNGDQGPDPVLALAAELARVEASIAGLTADLDAHGYSKTLSEQVRRQEERQAELQKQVAAARRKAAHPLSESWGETQSLIQALDEAPDPQDVRLRLRSELRQIIAEVWLLAVPRGRDRLAAAQIIFAGGKKRRDYLIFSRPAIGGAAGHRPARWWVQSFAGPAVPDELDLRNPSHVQALADVLERVPLTGEDR